MRATCGIQSPASLQPDWRMNAGLGRIGRAAERAAGDGAVGRKLRRHSSRASADPGGAARAVRRTAASGVAVVTFEPHPLTVLRPALAPPRLTPPSRQAVAAGRGRRDAAGDSVADDRGARADGRGVLGDPAGRSAADADDRRDVVQLRQRAAAGTIEKLRAWAAESPVQLEIVDPVSVALSTCRWCAVSSSLVRWLLAHGRVRDAAICLGRGYELEGEVVKGFQRGRTIGVPTANLAVRRSAGAGGRRVCRAVRRRRRHLSRGREHRDAADVQRERAADRGASDRVLRAICTGERCAWSSSTGCGSSGSLMGSKR